MSVVVLHKISLARWPSQKSRHVALALGYNDSISGDRDGGDLEALESDKTYAPLVLR